jgi:hypothetical protein
LSMPRGLRTQEILGLKQRGSWQCNGQEFSTNGSATALCERLATAAGARRPSKRAAVSGHLTAGIESQFLRWARNQNSPPISWNSRRLHGGRQLCTSRGHSSSHRHLSLRSFSAPTLAISKCMEPGSKAIPPFFSRNSINLRCSTWQESGRLTCNVGIAPSIRFHLDSARRTLIAVGAAHLFGQENAIGCSRCKVTLL